MASSPGTFALGTSRGRWKTAKHLLLLDRAIIDTLSGVGGCRRLVVTMPPRHGKSELCSKYLPAWYLGAFPDHRVILSSYEAAFAAEWGRKARNVLEEHGESIFGIQVAKSPASANSWNVHRHAGGMQTAGVGGPITGKGANLLIVDDPVKNAEEAGSQTMRAKAWDWWQSTAYTRLEPEGAAVVIQTRWHQDDLAGRLLTDQEQGGERWRVVNMPAISDDGKALWPERFPLERLNEIKRTLGSYFWSALYQQRPTPPEGGKFKREWFKVVPSLPEGARWAVRYWDKAATEGAGDYSAGCLIAELDGKFYVADMSRGQWSDLHRENMIKSCAERDRRRFLSVSTWIEQEPGSGGKDSAAATIRRLAGHSIRADRVTGDKETRASPFAAQCEAGNVFLVSGPWNAAYLDELCMFPNGTHDDQVDAASGAFNKLTSYRQILVA
jgi:predicted phage terminase large subunit-like protein